MDDPEDKYIGTFLDDLPHGFCKFDRCYVKYLGEHTEGSWGRFEGEFRKGKSHGKMTVYYK